MSMAAVVEINKPYRVPESLAFPLVAGISLQRTEQQAPGAIHQDLSILGAVLNTHCLNRRA